MIVRLSAMWIYFSYGVCLCLHLVGFLGSITLPSLAIEPQGTDDGTPSSYDQLEGGGVVQCSRLVFQLLHTHISPARNGEGIKIHSPTSQSCHFGRVFTCHRLL